MSTIVQKLESMGSLLLQKAWALLDGLFPPERRAEWIAKIKAFTVKHPKVMVRLCKTLGKFGTLLTIDSRSCLPIWH